MYFQTDEMSQPMGKVRTISGILDDLAGSFIDFAERNARFQNCFCGSICTADGLINSAVLLRRYFFIELSTCQCHAIAILPASNIKQDGVALFQNSIVRTVVSKRAVCTEANQWFKGISVCTETLINI